MARLVVADNEPDILDPTVARLRARGHEVRVARNGEEALELVLQDPPDALLIDLHMPRLDGDEVCRRVRADPRLAGVRTILMTASSGADELEDEICDFLLSKPFDAEALLGALGRALER